MRYFTPAPHTKPLTWWAFALLLLPLFVVPAIGLALVDLLHPIPAETIIAGGCWLFGILSVWSIGGVGVELLRVVLEYRVKRASVVRPEPAPRPKRRQEPFEVRREPITRGRMVV